MSTAANIAVWAVIGAYTALTVGSALLWIIWIVGGIFGDDGWRPRHNSQRGPR